MQALDPVLKKAAKVMSKSLIKNASDHGLPGLVPDHEQLHQRVPDAFRFARDQAKDLGLPPGSCIPIWAPPRSVLGAINLINADEYNYTMMNWLAAESLLGKEIFEEPWFGRAAADKEDVVQCRCGKVWVLASRWVDGARIKMLNQECPNCTDDPLTSRFAQPLFDHLHPVVCTDHRKTASDLLLSIRQNQPPEQSESEDETLVPEDEERNANDMELCFDSPRVGPRSIHN
jgi:hypothetical protein